MGDFNLPNYDWKNHSSPESKTFNDFLLDAEPIHQLVPFITRGDHLLDLILSNDPNICSELEDNPPIGCSDHLTIKGIINIDNVVLRDTRKIIKLKAFQKENYTKIGNSIRATLANKQFNVDPNKNWSIFDKAVTNSINLFVPKTNFKFYKGLYISKENVKIYKQFHRQYNKWKKHKIPKSLIKYKLLKLTFKRNIENDRVKFENGLINSGSRKAF